MCGGVRGVGAGGIVSSAYCLLYKLGTLKPTKKQIVGLLNHCDSPYIRGVGFMYLRCVAFGKVFRTHICGTNLFDLNNVHFQIHGEPARPVGLV